MTIEQKKEILREFINQEGALRLIIHSIIALSIESADDTMLDKLMLIKANFDALYPDGTVHEN